MPFEPGPGGAPGSVRVVLEVGRRVEVHDAGDRVDVDAAGGDVGGDERLEPTVGERRQRTFALTLRAVAVDRGAAHTALLELLGDLVGAVLGPAEHDRRTGELHDVGGQLDRSSRSAFQNTCVAASWSSSGSMCRDGSRW